MGLPTPGGPSSRTLVASATKARLASSLTPNGDWVERLVALASRAVTYGVPEVRHLGFPEGWYELEI